MIVLTLPAAADTQLGPDIYDPEFTDGFACWMDTEFVFSELDMATGGLQGEPTRIAIPAPSFGDVYNGPEVMRTVDGDVSCVAKALNPGVVRFNASGGYIIPGTERLRFPMPPSLYACETARFHALRLDGTIFLVENDVPVPLTLQGFAGRWVSCDEILVKLGARYYIFHIRTGQTTTVCRECDYFSGGSYAIQTADNERIIAFLTDTKAEIYVDTETGWLLDRTLASPDPNLPFFWSGEMFEWQGRPWLTGFISKNYTFSPSKLFLYDIRNDVWTIIGGENAFLRDPEGLALNDGNVAVYYLDPFIGTTHYFAVSPEPAD